MLTVVLVSGVQLQSLTIAMDILINLLTYTSLYYTVY